MKRKLFALFVLLAMLFSASGVAPVRADAYITVNYTADTTTAGDGNCTLREAIANANGDSDGSSGDCTAGSGVDTILFAPGLGTATIVVGSELLVFNAVLTTIDGDNRITVSGGDSTRVFYVTGTLTLQNISVVHGNDTTGSGGGGLRNEGTTTISHSIFSDNYSSTSGGGIVHASSVNPLTIIDSTFSNNQANSGEGGGVDNVGGGPAYITNSTFTNNSSPFGGGVTNNSSTITIINSTFSGNTATGSGGAVFINQGGAQAPVTTIYNSILANSTAPADCYNYASSGTLQGGNNIIETTGGPFSNCSSITASTTDPMLGTLTGSPAYFPLAGPPAIDTGDDTQCPATDQSGVPRPWGAHCDIGAFEEMSITVNSTADTTAMDGACTLREAITNANTNSNTNVDCSWDTGFDVILFASSLGTDTITLGSALPDINDVAGLMIDGDNRITISGNDSVRVFHVNGGASGGGFTLQNISVTHASASNGGGLYNVGGKVVIKHSIFSNNTVTGSGGGVYTGGSAAATMTITDSTFSNNSATEGGGVSIASNGGSTLTIANSTFSNNSASYGGGVNNLNSTLTLLNSTFSGNSATSTGAAVGTFNNAAIPTTTIRNTILSNSVTGVDCWNYATGILIGGNNIIGTTGSGSNTCSSITSSTADPMLGSLNGSPAYFPLLFASPAIDTGNDTVCAAAPVNGRDQRGVVRPQVTHCDIGSYEKEPNSIPTDISLSTNSVAENQPVGTTVGTLTTTDSNIDDTHNYSFCGGADDGSFSIGGAGNNELRTAAVFDYETKNSYAICLRTDDGNIGTFDKNFTINVTDVIETVTVTFRSTGTQDGWILETSETSGKGGNLDSTSQTLRLGDDNTRKQYRSIISFATGVTLPDTAVITKVTLKVKRQGVTGGGNPVTTFLGFMVDIKKGTFGTSALQATDFQATAKPYGAFNPALVGGWYSIDLTAGKAYINKLASGSGLTQIRLRFKSDDNNNTVANYLSLYSGNAGTASRPKLIIEYYVP